MANMFTLEQLLAEEEDTTQVSTEQPSTEVITKDKSITPVITPTGNSTFTLEQLLAEEEPVDEVQQVLLSQSEVQRSAPLSDAGPQVPRADPVDDPLGADAALSGEMQSSIYNRDRTLMEELSGYVTPEGTKVPSKYIEDSILDKINAEKPEGTEDLFDIDDMSAEDLAKSKSEFITELTNFKTNEVRDPLMYLVAGVAKVDLKLGVKLVDGLQYAMAGVGDFMIKDMELAKNGTYGVIGEQYYKGAKSLLSGFGRFKEKTKPKDLVMGYFQGLGAAFESVGVTSLGTGTFAQAYSINAITKNLRSLKANQAMQDAIRDNVGGMEIMTREARLAAQQRAKKAADSADPGLRQDVIDSIEERLGGRRISDGEKGSKVVNYDTVRNVGKAITLEAFEKQQLAKGDIPTESMRDVTAPKNQVATQSTDLTDIDTPNQTLYEPIMKPENIDALIAIAAKYKKQFEGVKDADGLPMWNNKLPDGSKKNVIEILFELTAKKELIPSQDLIDDLAVFGMSFDDYVMSTNGSVSLAATVMRKYQQLGKMTPQRQLDFEANTAILEAEGSGAKMWARLEGMRKGVMVSQWATLARNFTSTFVRTPLEGLFNVIDSAIVEFDKPIRAARKTQKVRTTTTTGAMGELITTTDNVGKPTYTKPQGGFVGAAYKIVSPDTWARSFALMRYMYSRPDVAAGITDLILKRPELAKQSAMFYERVNDIQVARGRGPDSFTSKLAAGKYADAAVSEGEDIVSAFNIPSALQEMMTRKAVFVSELERTVFDNYGLDFKQALLDGKLPDLLKDTSVVRPEGTPSFLTLVDEANYRALAATYAGEPQVPMLRELNRFISKYGTVAEPFSRFLFTSMEFMGQSMGGASIPLTKKLSNLTTAGTLYKDYSWNPKKFTPFTSKDRERIARNIVGIAAVGAMIQVIKSTGMVEEGSPEAIVTGPTNEQVNAFLISVENEREQINNDKTLDPAYRKQEMARLDFEVAEIKEARENGIRIDMTAVYPIAQFNWLAQAAIDEENGVFRDKFNEKAGWLNFKKLFLSSSLRSTNQYSIIEDVSSMFDATDLDGGEKLQRSAGKLLSNYVKSWLAQFSQVVNIDRARGYRTDVVKELNTEDPAFGAAPTLDNMIPDVFGSAFEGPLRTAGITTTADEERDAVNKSNVFMPEGFRRRLQTSRVLLGVSATDRKTPEGEYLTKYGVNYTLASRSKFPAVETVENAMIEFALPDLVKEAKEVEAGAEAAWDNPNSSEGKLLIGLQKGSMTKENHVYFQVKGFLRAEIKKLKTVVRENSWTETDLNEYQEAAIAYRRLTKQEKKNATRWLGGEIGLEEIDLYNTGHLEDLVLYAKNPKIFGFQ